MRVSDEELEKRSKDTIQMWVGSVIEDLRDLRKLAREILRDSGPASEPLFDRMVPKAGWNALKAHLEDKP